MSPARRCTARRTGEWEFRAGPVFANVVLVDEVNRASPRTQAALLEPMEEHQVTVDGETHPLPQPFFLVATQNPFGSAGTFPLPESQLDRFALVAVLGLPGRAAEREILDGEGGVDALAAIDPVTTPARADRRRSPRSATCTARTPCSTTCSTSPRRRASHPGVAARRVAACIARACCTRRVRTRR